MPSIEKIRPFENFHIVLWLIKDMCWVMEARLLGMFMIIPALGVAIFITAQLWNIYSDRMHNMAVCCWLCANSIWMTGEFFYDDSLRWYALIFFLIGIAIVGWYYIEILIKSLR